MCFSYKPGNPSDIIPRESITPGTSLPDTYDSIKIRLNQIVIPFNKPPIIMIPSIFTPSMEPVMALGHNYILVQGQDELEQKIMRDWLETQSPGNIVAYRLLDKFIMHRIKKAERDSQGIKYTFRGDNNQSDDPDKIRSKNVEWVCIGVIY